LVIFDPISSDSIAVRGNGLRSGRFFLFARFQPQQKSIDVRRQLLVNCLVEKASPKGIDHKVFFREQQMPAGPPRFLGHNRLAIEFQGTHLALLRRNPLGIFILESGTNVVAKEMHLRHALEFFERRTGCLQPAAGELLCFAVLAPFYDAQPENCLVIFLKINIFPIKKTSGIRKMPNKADMIEQLHKWGAILLSPYGFWKRKKRHWIFLSLH